MIPKNIRGVTLVELMIVVAIIAILAALATVAYGNYIRQGKIQRLTAMAQDIAQGQERYRSRNNTYYPAAGGAQAFASNEDAFRKLLDFATPVPADVTITTESWVAGGACTICAGGAFDGSSAGFAVRVVQDMKGDGEPNTTVTYSNIMPAPLTSNEGE